MPQLWGTHSARLMGVVEARGCRSFGALPAHTPDEDEAAHEGRAHVVCMVARHCGLRLQAGHDELLLADGRLAKQAIHRPRCCCSAGSRGAQTGAQGQALQRERGMQLKPFINNFPHKSPRSGAWARAQPQALQRARGTQSWPECSPQALIAVSQTRASPTILVPRLD